MAIDAPDLDTVLALYRAPHNMGPLATPDLHGHYENPLCGEGMDLYVQKDSQGLLRSSFTGESCSISVAAASVLTDYLNAATAEDMYNLSAEYFMEILPFHVPPGRIACAQLPWHTLQEALKPDNAEHHA